MLPSPGYRTPPDLAAGPFNPDNYTTTGKEIDIMRRRRILRKAVKTAIIAKSAHLLGRRAERHLRKHQ
jgi:hypothetical protein